MTDYQEEDDEAHVIRVESSFPPGVEPFPSEDHWVAVAGITKYEDAVRAFIASKVRHVTLEREPSNPHDRNAVRVFGLWRGHDGYAAGGALGYLPREEAAAVATLSRRWFLHGRLVALYAPRPGKNPGIRIQIGHSKTADPTDQEIDIELAPADVPAEVGRESRAARRPSGRVRSVGPMALVLRIVLVLALVAVAFFLALRK